MDVVVWASVIGFLFGTVNGAIPKDRWFGFVACAALLLAAIAISFFALAK